MKNNLTELVFILDRSGSMSGLESDTIGGFNSMIERQKKIDGQCYVTTVLFDTRIDRIHDRENLKDIPPMTEKDYVPGGCTALLDAIGNTIDHIVHIHKYARPDDVPEHTTFVIMTDGMENASHYYSSNEVKKKVEHEKEKYGWEFLFLAANIDALEAADRIGIRPDRAADYLADSKGTELAFHSLSEAVSEQRMGFPIGANWSRKIEKDHKLRSKRKADGKTGGI